MGRYDSGYGARGGWRGPFRGGFGGPGGPADDGYEGARPSAYGGEWSRGYGPGGPSAGGWIGGGGHNRSGFLGGSRPLRGGSPSGYGGRGFVGGGGAGRGYGGPERGEYGSAYEEYGGWPGDRERGMTYGGGYGSRASQRRGYDAGYAREPFMPDEAYRRHPEYRQEHRPREWEAYQHAYGQELNDDEVRDAVYRRMESDAWLDPQRIDVRVEDGVVTLTGEVDDFLEARYAWDDAWEADGVRGVVNNIAVRSDQPHDAHGDIVPQSAGDRTSEADAG